MFSNLDIGIQDIILTNYEYVAKWFVFIFLIFLSSYYIYNFKNLKATKFISKALFRLIFVGVSWIIVLSSPLQFLLMSPSYSFFDYYNLYLNLYYVAVVLFGLLVFFDFIRYGFIGLLRLAGLDIGDSNVNELVSSFYNYKDFKKIGGKR